MVERDADHRRLTEMDGRIDAAFERAMIGEEGSEGRKEWVSDRLFLRTMRKMAETRREQRRTAWVGVASSIIVTVMTTILTYATGVLQWLLSFTPTKH